MKVVYEQIGAITYKNHGALRIIFLCQGLKKLEFQLAPGQEAL